MRCLIVAHGLEGSPEGEKVRAYRAAGLTVHAPDGRGESLAVRVQQLRGLVREHPGSILVGSSYGGLAATALVHELGDEHSLHVLVLLAPALQWREPPVDDPAALMVPETLAATVFHGEHDSVVPIAVSRALVARCPHVRLVATDDGHRLTATLPEIVEHLLAHVR